MKFKFRRFITPTFVVVVVCIFYVSVVLLNNNNDPMTTVLLGTRFSQGDPLGTQGYDGQFVYQIAVQPFEAASYIDVPAYRYQRILYPMLARFLSWGQPELIPWMLIIINLFAIGLGTWGIEKFLLGFKVSRWYALVYGLYGGQFVALRTDLTEPLAYALVIWAMLAWAKERHIWAIVAFALAALTKETTLVFLAAYILYTVTQRQWRWSIALFIGGAGPFILYQFFLWGWLGSFGVGSGGAGATPFSFIPLGGWLSIAFVHFGAFLIISLIVVPMSILPAIAGVWLSTRHLWQRQGHPLVYSLLLNSLVILFIPASTFREPVAMMRLTFGLVISMILFGALVRSWRILNYCYFWLFTNVLLLKGVAE